MVSRTINHLHEKYLRIVYRDKRSSFENLLDKNKIVLIHVKKSPDTLEMFKIAKNLSAPIVRGFLIFEKQNNI